MLTSIPMFTTKYKSIFVALFLGSLVLGSQAVLLQSAQGQPASKTLTPTHSFKKGVYRNKDFGFSLKVPLKGWEALIDPPLPGALLVAQKQGMNQGPWTEGVSFHPTLTVGLEILPEGVVLKDYAEAAMEVLEKVGWTLKGEKSLRMAGKSAYEIRAVRKGDNIALLQRFVVLKGGAVVMAATARPGQMAKMAPQFTKIYDSFKLR